MGQLHLSLCLLRMYPGNTARPPDLVSACTSTAVSALSASLTPPHFSQDEWLPSSPFTFYRQETRLQLHYHHTALLSVLCVFCWAKRELYFRPLALRASATTNLGEGVVTLYLGMARSMSLCDCLCSLATDKDITSRICDLAARPVV